MKELKLTLPDLQKKIGVAYRTITRWLSEDDFPKHQNLNKLADVLEVEPYNLVIRWKAFAGKKTNHAKDQLRYILKTN